MSTEMKRRFRASIPEFLYTKNKVIFVESIVSLLVVWAVLAYGFDLTHEISSPTLVGAEMYDLLRSGDWIPHFADTIRRVIYGFLLTMVIGTVLGVAIGMSDFWQLALQDYITIGLALPSLFAAVFAAMWFGVSDATPMVAGAAIAFPFLTQNVFEGVQNIDHRLIEMSSSFGVSRARVIRRVIFNAILPEWFAGSRYAFAICWKITTLAELIATESGIGFMIQQEWRKVSLTGVLTWTILFTFMIMIFEYGILQQLEKRLFDWRQDTKGMMGAA